MTSQWVTNADANATANANANANGNAGGSSRDDVTKKRKMDDAKWVVTGVPECVDEISLTLNLTVTNLRGESFAFEVMMGEATSSIAVLKKLIEQVEGTPAERQLLAYKPEDGKGEGEGEGEGEDEGEGEGEGEDEGEGEGYLTDDVVVKQSCSLIVQRGSINFTWDLDSPLFKTTMESESNSPPSSPQADDPRPVFDVTTYATVRRVGPDNFHQTHTMTVNPPMDLVAGDDDLDMCRISLRIREIALESESITVVGRAAVGLQSATSITPNCSPSVACAQWILQLGNGETVPYANHANHWNIQPYPLDSVVTMQLDRKESLLTFWVNGKRAGKPRRTYALLRYVVDRHCAVQWVVNAARRHTTISIVDDPVLFD
jgi:hypothetical protein